MEISLISYLQAREESSHATVNVQITRVLIICSHAIAVAEVNCMLEEFISQFQKLKKCQISLHWPRLVYPKGEDEREESQLERGENFLLQQQEYL